ncbi:subtilisin inhibitor CLSI-I-like isoform X1 [Actinidia eriantha]|uniref:subtilisin inhibitor CLSI-I-like isoform X1 n=1 Tax=Actinidia eriantha TaxID=165200 RepID=UPI002584DC09|nr:subtilisin inhibitor CLSI-I-like isoform X1 [Actinidia eriantha]
MAEENQPTEVPQEQVVPEATTVFPPRPIYHIFGSGTAKTTWPELVGLAAEEAEKKIKEEMPGARVQVVPPNCFVTMDFNQRRVRLHVDSARKVAQTPRIG